MKTVSFKNILVHSVLVLAGAAFLSGCNTVQGMGQDVQAGGQAITNMGDGQKEQPAHKKTHKKTTKNTKTTTTHTKTKKTTKKHAEKPAAASATTDQGAAAPAATDQGAAATPNQ